ncbi:peptidoglycan editing factor PgeF [Longirhabdus pacifica]|uniref:peptidoglycan editing factor PgeF n=1 Tax=Longirhabdus pacifica TaxID=2305227 RepID=UPI0010088700|nr:peptidoglycan editing factor PgeF [Longirhabdus pacifica]
MEPFPISHHDNGLQLLFLQKWMSQFSWLTVGFTTRHGGSSTGNYESLNCGLHVGDMQEDVVMNRVKVAEQLRFPFSYFTCAEQVHGNQVAVVNEHNRGSGKDSLHDVIAGVDAIVTNVPNVLLASFYADCVPLFIIDPVHKVVGLAHAGWKGTCLNIAQNTVNTMNEHFGTDASECVAAIGPSIGGCCYEVGKEVCEQIKLTCTDEKLIQNEIIKEQLSGKYHINLKEMNRQIMMKVGILPNNIETSSWCTLCRSDLFFSYRQNNVTGRMMSWIGLQGERMFTG